MGRRRVTKPRPCRIALLLAATMAWPLFVAAIEHDGYYERKEEGWFWKEFIPEPEPPPLETPVPEQVPAAPQAPEPFSAAWLREQIPLARDRAMEQPTSENVRAFYYLQRYAMDMAERFATVSQQVTLTDPLLDENNRRPLSTYGSGVVDQVARERKEEIAQKISTEVGLWYFYRSDCPYCKAQEPVLARLQQKLGLVVLPIALDGKAMEDSHFKMFVPDRGQARMLKVTQTPTLYMVKKPNEYVLLSEGLLTDEGFVQRMIVGAREAGWISEQEFNETKPVRPLDSIQALEPLQPDSMSDPMKLVEYLRQQFASR